MYTDTSPVYLNLPESPIKLRVWEQNFGSPSMDPACVEIMTLLKLNNVKFDTELAWIPQYLPLPSLEMNNKVFVNVKEMVDEVFKTRRSTDSSLPTHVARLIEDYKSYFRENFADVFYFECWLNQRNLEFTTKSLYYGIVPFPLSYFYVRGKVEETEKYFRCLIGERDPLFFIVRLLDKCRICLQDFSNLLNDGRFYMLGGMPTSLDAYVYSHLVVALYIPFPDPRVQVMLRKHTNLVSYVERITKTYYPKLDRTIKYVEPVGVATERASAKSLMVAGTVVTTVMVLYAFHIGLFKLPILKNDDYSDTNLVLNMFY